MGEHRRRDESPDKAALRRETRIPLPAGGRPCLMVGLTLAAIFIAGSIDGLLWQQRQERRAHRQHTATLEVINDELAAELARARAEVERLEADLAESRHHVRVLHDYVLVDRAGSLEVGCPFAPDPDAVR